MRNEFAADIGDFGKYGLLRWLCGVIPHGDMISLGIHWRLFDGQGSAKNDGKFIDFLRGENQVTKSLLACDSDLAIKLRQVIDDERSIAAIEQSRALPDDTEYFGRGLNFDGVPARQRPHRREEWSEAALERLDGSDLVFVDPDNGLQVKSRSRTSHLGPKYVFYDELVPYWNKGHGLVIYQHLARNKKHMAQILERAGDLIQSLDGAAPIPLWYHRGTSRVFFVIPNQRRPDVANMIRQRVQSFVRSPWVFARPG